MSADARAGLDHAGLEQALALGGRMLAAARDGDWAQVARLDAARRRRLGCGHPGDDRSRALLALMLEHDRQVLARAGEARDRLRAELAEQCGRRHALDAYVAVARAVAVR